ncbi:penicillin acylase family protein [Salinirussus salinus]|uniref:penicillin acylase family protein n=1 Tax=Salinirussus salinus TaxID=1198300 RepID=UPI00135B138B|nr:penicillin acylase family protein [Salinirussus salinus]
MDYETTRRAVLGALVAGGTGAVALSPAGGLLERFAPFSGRAWDAAERVPSTVESPYGPATITYDDYHVPHVEADTEEAAYFAVGYAQAADRLFEMDLVRRRMRGTLAEVAGEQVVDSDVFNVRMDFLGAAEASAEAIAGTDTERMTEAFADGVNAYIDEGSLPLEFGLLGYEPREWSVVASLLVGAQVSWGLTGSFRTLQRALLRERLDADTYRQRYPARLDHGYPILRPDRVGGEVHGVAGRGVEAASADARVGKAVDADFADWLGRFEPPPYLGSNSWLVAGEHTASGSPIVANDMHLTLMAPPVWYEQRVSAGEVDVRGVAFPGVPFVVAGENDHGAWGFTNTGADVVDLYTYETDDARERYRYQGEWREFDTETRTVEVAGGENREVTVKKTVHGAFLDREVDGDARHVGVAWTGMSGTRESQAIHEFSRSTGREDVLESLELFDAPTQNFVYADREGRTLYWATGKIPIRRVDGEVVRGDRVFDGSAGEAEWEGFEPFGQSSWEGFVPFEDKPGVVQPSYVGTANQRLVDDPVYPIGQEYASGFRGTRIYEELDAAVEEGRAIDREFMQGLQRDTVDVRARTLVPAILDARDRMPDAADPYLDAMADWDYRLDRDSTAALVFRFFYEFFREETWRDDYEDVGLDSSYWPQEWVLVTLPPDDEAFGGDRAGVLARAMERAVERVDSEGWETYGDYNRTVIDHPFGGQVGALNYPRYPTDGGSFTVMNFRKEGGAGSSQRTVYPMDGETVTVLPGGNDGSYFSEHYDDQLRLWADGEYRPAPRAVDGDPDITVEGRRGGAGG